MPRVMSAAFVLSPPPRPSDIPAAIASTFLTDPPISTPRTSWLTYTRRRGPMNAARIRSAVFGSKPAATMAVGTPWPTSSAWLGP